MLPLSDVPSSSFVLLERGGGYCTSLVFGTTVFTKGLDGDDLDRVRAPAMSGDQRLCGHARLRQRERRTPGAQAQRSIGEKHIRLALMTSGIRWKRQ